MLSAIAVGGDVALRNSTSGFEDGWGVALKSLPPNEVTDRMRSSAFRDAGSCSFARVRMLRSFARSPSNAALFCATCLSRCSWSSCFRNSRRTSAASCSARLNTADAVSANTTEIETGIIQALTENPVTGFVGWMAATRASAVNASRKKRSWITTIFNSRGTVVLRSSRKCLPLRTQPRADMLDVSTAITMNTDTAHATEINLVRATRLGSGRPRESTRSISQEMAIVAHTTALVCSPSVVHCACMAPPATSLLAKHPR